MRESILLIDDEDIILKSFSSDLRHDGFVVTPVFSGELALKKLQHNKYDVVITDLKMGQVDGIEVLADVKRTSPQTVVIILTGQADLSSAVEALRLGADDFLQKPCDYEELKVRIINGLEKNKILVQQLTQTMDSVLTTEEALRESEEKLRTMADFAYDWEYWIDENGEFVYTSPSCERISGYSADEFIEDHTLLETICFQADRAMFSRHLQLEEKDIDPGLSLEFRIVTKGSKIKWLSHSCRLVYSEDGRYLGRRASNRDITVRKNMEEELIKAKKTQTSSILAGGIAHDYNNLLTAIMGNIDLAMMNVSDHSEINHYLENAKSASLRARDLTSKFLAFSSASSPYKKIISIESLLRGAVELALSGSNVNVDFIVLDKLWLVEVDEDQLRQAFTNIIFNAKEAMSHGGTVRVEVENFNAIERETPSFLPSEKFVRITVLDSGCGISIDDLDNIFDPYFSTKQRGSQKGMGLGLTVAHSVIEKHLGLIDIHSTPGEGTSVIVFIPAVDKEIELAGDSISHGNQVVDHTLKNKRIMVMDDEEIIRDVASTMLAQAGYDVDLVCDGEEAISLYKKRANSESPIDLVILDLTIAGGMGGKDTVLKIHTLNPDAKVIVSSGYLSDPIMINYSVYGFCGSIGKPYLFQDFIKTVAKSLK